MLVAVLDFFQCVFGTQKLKIDLIVNYLKILGQIYNVYHSTSADISLTFVAFIFQPTSEVKAWFVVSKTLSSSYKIQKFIMQH